MKKYLVWQLDGNDGWSAEREGKREFLTTYATLRIRKKYQLQPKLEKQKKLILFSFSSILFDC